MGRKKSNDPTSDREGPFGLPPEFLERLALWRRQMMIQRYLDRLRRIKLPATPYPPSDSAGRDRSPGRERLRDRLELILAVFDDHGPGPFRGRTIAKSASHNYDSHLRADLSELKRLGYLEHDGRGYLRTDKPYRCP
jgi:hypothetical protein